MRTHHGHLGYGGNRQDVATRHGQFLEGAPVGTDTSVEFERADRPVAQKPVPQEVGDFHGWWAQIGGVPGAHPLFDIVPRNAAHFYTALRIGHS
ncbi:hypothetical protein SFR_1828 [Streptomyces sp. FR-008]|nr:hypothetical protein SFR_1828 [Streptomyces sp. FR-008]